MTTMDAAGQIARDLYMALPDGATRWADKSNDGTQWVEYDEWAVAIRDDDGCLTWTEYAEGEPLAGYAGTEAQCRQWATKWADR